MAGANQELGDQFARLHLEPGNIFKGSDVQKIGEASLAALEHLLQLMHYVSEDTAPMTGVLGEFGGTDNHLLVTKGTGDLVFDITTGMGFVFDAAQISADPFNSLAYRAAILRSSGSGVVTAHDVTNPRIDIVYLTVGTSTDEPVNRKSRIITGPDAGDPEVPDPSVDIRTFRSGTLAVIAGTPAATPVAPTVPAGGLPLAEALVPATSGAITIRDIRNFIQLGELFRGVPPHWYQSPHVCGVTPPDNMEVTYASATTVDVADGCHVTGTVAKHSQPQTLTLSALPSGNDRIDLVYVTPGNVLAIAAGVPAATPVTPNLPGGSQALAELYVTDTTGLAGSGAVTDLRRFGPIGAEQIQSGAVIQGHMATEERTLSFGGAAFHDDSNNSFVATDGGYRPSANATAYNLTATIQLPEGAEILEVGVAGSANGTGGGVALNGRLTRSRLTGTDETLSGTVFTPSVNTAANILTSGVDTTPAVAGQEVVDNVNYGYEVGCGFTTPAAATDIKFHGMWVKIRTNQHLS